MAEPLAISTGSGRGEAVFLGESSFDPVQHAYRTAKEKADSIREMGDVMLKNRKEDEALLTDDIKTKWDADTFNYFQPKAAALKEEITNAYKEHGGNIPPVQRMEFKNKWGQLESERDVNNALWEDYQNQVQLLDKDTEGKYDRNASVQLMNLWRNPYSDPAAKADIQQNYGGNINKWRAANAQKFRIIPSFSEDKYYSDQLKDLKPVKSALKDEKGVAIEKRHSTGEPYNIFQTSYTPEQINNQVNRVMNESNYQSDKAKERAATFVDNNFHVTEDGKVTYNSQLSPEGKSALQYMINYAGDLRGNKESEIKKKLERGYIAQQIYQKGKGDEELRDIGFAPQPREGAKGFYDNFSVAVAPLSEITTKQQISLPEQKKLTDPWVSLVKKTKTDTTPYIAIERTGGKSDTESIQLTINGKQVRPIGYKISNGKVYMRGSEAQSVPSGNVDFKGDPIMTTKYVVTDDIPVTDEVSANIAAHYGFKTFDQFKGMLEKEAAGAGIKQKSGKFKGDAKDYKL